MKHSALHARRRRRGNICTCRKLPAGFAAFYELYRRYAASLPLETLLRGQTDAGAEALRGLPFEGRLSVVEFLLHSLQTQLCAMEDASALAFSAESFLKSVPAGEGYAARAEKQLKTAARRFRSAGNAACCPPKTNGGRRRF